MSAPVPAARRARTRTGCKTCRQRKLKCDEVKPICGHCRKSNRECQPSEGVAFRHAQNAGFGEQDGGNELGNFYKYRQKFSNTYFVPVPQELTFVHVTDPYEDETAMALQAPPLRQQPQQPQLQQSQNVQAIPTSSSQFQHPQYVDVAATSLKAMIDPNLEAGTGGGTVENVVSEDTGGPERTSTTAGVSMGSEDFTTEVESLNQTILNALNQSDASMSMR